MRLKQFFLFFFTTAVFAGINSSAFAHGITEEARRRMIEGGDLQYLILGAEHMVTGYDHLLFLFGVMFFLTRFTSILKFVTAFTLGHTITLISATYLQITMDYYLIDTIIAFTVIYKGFENLDGFKKYLNREAPSLLLMVLLFGLIHGFGLSTRLQTLPIDADTGMLMHIISFNVGVELGQIAALVIMWIVLHFWRSTKSFKAFSGAANVSLIVIGALLALMQLHGFVHTTYGEEFPISKDDHSHTHATMLKNSQGQTEYGGEVLPKRPRHD